MPMRFESMISGGSIIILCWRCWCACKVCMYSRLVACERSIWEGAGGKCDGDDSRRWIEIRD